ncbi:peptidase A24 [Pseudomonas fluorescens ABAC62]|nr:peptidase A24 [Pseudomonas fluorescens ABAC62]
MIHGVLIVFWLGLCSVQDIRTRQLSNGLTLGAALLALIYLLWTGATWLGAPAGEGGWAFGLALLLTLPGYALSRFGAGDVKLLAALGLASSVDHLLWSLIGAAIVQAGWLFVYQRVGAHHPGTTKKASKKQPFAPCVLAGFALYWLWTH